MLHTFIWGIFVGCIVAIPALAAAGNTRAAEWLSVLVWGEVAVLAANRMRCPLTDAAARYTDDRSPNFDIFLPAWISKHNLLIFGTLFAAGELYLLWRVGRS